MQINYISALDLGMALAFYTAIMLISIGVTNSVCEFWTRHFSCKHTSFSNINENDEKGKLVKVITKCECGHKSYYTPMSSLSKGRGKKNIS